MAVVLVPGAAAVSGDAVELSGWEQDKENVRPQRCGRSAAVLAEVFCKKAASTHPQASSEETRRCFETRLTAARTALASPGGAVGTFVQLWCDYVRWAAEWFPSDAREERAVLERATRELAEEPRCRDDERQLQLWLRLADLLQEPQEVFSFLWSRGIGVGHAQFYEAWASSLERQQRFGEAEEVLGIGLARGASPAGRLRAFQVGLAQRMEDRVRHTVDDALEAAALGRPALNAISTTEASLLARPGDRRGAQFAGLGPLAGRPVLSVAATPIFADEGFAGAAPPRASIFDACADWLLPPAQEARRNKENQRDAALELRNARAQFQKQRPTRCGTRASVASFQIFVDPECGAATPITGSGPAAAAASAPASSSAPAPAPLAAARPRRAADVEPQEAVALAAAMQVPGAPLRDRRRQRPSEQSELTDDLVASLSNLRLREGPPVKKLCISSGDYVSGVSDRSSSSFATVATPPGTHVNVSETSIDVDVDSSSRASSEAVENATSQLDVSLSPTAPSAIQTPQRRPGTTVRARNLQGDSSTALGRSPLGEVTSSREHCGLDRTPLSGRDSLDISAQPDLVDDVFDGFGEGFPSFQGGGFSSRFIFEE